MVRLSVTFLQLFAGATAISTFDRVRIARVAATQLVEPKADTRGRTHQALFDAIPNFDLQNLKGTEGVTITYDKDARALRLEQGVAPGRALAWGTYNDTITQNGWSELNVFTSDVRDSPNDVKMYAAGMVEGLLTSMRMSEFYGNSQQLLIKREQSAHALGAVRQLFQNQLGYLRKKSNVRQHVLAEEPSEPYWQHARYLLFQLWGLCDGYNIMARRMGGDELGMEDMMLLNAGGELPQLMEAYAPASRQNREVVTSFLQTKKQVQEDMLDDAHWEKKVAESGRCSALVRLTDGNKDIFMGHSTWDDYSKMTRIFKYYNFGLAGAGTVAKRIAFSSYPGAISSTDDFYVMDSGLSVMETSLEILDQTAWDKVMDFPKYSSIPNFVHLMITNRLSNSSSEWASRWKSTNTGTFTSQWMVVDYKKFKPGNQAAKDTFWVVESVPGAVEAKDMSDYLNSKRYWPSFNRPFFRKTRQVSGHMAAEDSHGPLYSWSSNPRALIFANVGTGANALFDMRSLMTRNTYPNSGMSPNEPGHDISARMDLSKEGPIPNGGIDAKVVNRCLVQNLEVQAISGPSHSVLPPFRWVGDNGTQTWPGYPHEGQPDVWNFDFVQITADGLNKDLSDTIYC